MTLLRWNTRGVLITLALAPLLLQAQTGTGSIQGTARDTTGAVIPGAKVVLAHSQRAVSFSSMTNSAGFYVFPAVQRGPYELQTS